MAKDMNKMSKAELLALVEELQATSVTPEESIEDTRDDEMEELRQQLQSLTMAFLGKVSDKTEKKSEMVAVRLSGVTTLIVQVEDINGVKKDVVWLSRGDTRLITPKQLEDLRDRAPHIFEQGKLTVVGEETDNPNVVGDFDAFLTGLKGSDVDEAIAKISNEGLLAAIYNHIEAKRYVFEDKDGNPLKDKDGGPRMETVSLPSWLATIQIAIGSRLNRGNNVQITSDAVE